MNAERSQRATGGDTEPPMTQQRREQIVDLVNQRGAVRVGELSREFHTSEVTIRNDLTHLEREGRLTRDRGGAIPSQREITSLLAVEERAHIRIEEKRRIARTAAALVHDRDYILMDAGTTVVEMTPHLAGIQGLTVVTNALNVALRLGAQTDAHVILVGGTINRSSSSTLGPIAERQIAGLNVQKLFLGTQALDEQGLTDTTIEIAQIKEAMIRSAKQTILLSDSEKWGKRGFIKVAPLESMQRIITDTGLPDSARATIESAGIELQLA